jgi:hypothetical protein
MKWSFTEIRDAFTKAPMLAQLDPAKPICLETNASGFAIASIILRQNNEVCGSAEGAAHGEKAKMFACKDYQHPVALWSWSMSLAE